MWYAVHDASGALVSLGTVLADPLPADLTAVVLAGEPDLVAQQWDAQALDFVPRPPERAMDPYEWWKRFTLAEEAAIREAARTDAFVMVLLSRLAAPTLRVLHLDDAVVVQGVNYLQSNGLLTAERAAEVRA